MVVVALLSFWMEGFSDFWREHLYVQRYLFPLLTKKLHAFFSKFLSVNHLFYLCIYSSFYSLESYASTVYIICQLKVLSMLLSSHFQPFVAL